MVRLNIPRTVAERAGWPDRFPERPGLLAEWSIVRMDSVSPSPVTHRAAVTHFIRKTGLADHAGRRIAS
ncbi:hypothetical protein FMUAM8_40600 [Nocardia cyriacigeorgica]|nr:hypothetical protein FMUAM8_40600 [Nocardia cyriacigeorgica]